MGLAMLKRGPVEPLEDYGFFGPDSVTWRVWTYPTSLTIGFQRAVVIEELDPALIAAVDKSGGVRERTRTRYDRTLKYFALVAIGDSRAAMSAADVLVRIHAKVVGTEPLTGNPYAANDPDSQLWIHLTAWHSILYVYEKYGPGKLSPQDEARFWEECAVAAELQTCDPADIPRTREGVVEYFEYMRPRLSGSEAAQSMMDFLLDADVLLPQLPLAIRPFGWAFNKFHRMATIATMPMWMRKMAGLHQSRWVGTLLTPWVRFSFGVVARNPWLELAILRFISPSTAPVAAPMLFGIPPTRPETLTPAQARERYEYLRPAESNAKFKAEVAAKIAQRTAAAAPGETVPAVGKDDESELLLGPVT